MANVHYLGHGSLRFCSQAGTVVYLDPYVGEDYSLPADLILVTHQHFDHNVIDKPARKADCQLIQNDLLIKDGKYAKMDIKDIHIEAVPAYNKNHKREECVGIILEIDGKKIYCSGDTNTTDDMPRYAGMKLDYAFFCTDGEYNMDIPEAMECARTIKARHSIPIHTKVGELFDEERARRFQVEGALIIRPGETLEL